MDFSSIINCDHFSVVPSIINDNLQKCVDPLTAPLSNVRSIYVKRYVSSAALCYYFSWVACECCKLAPPPGDVIFAQLVCQLNYVISYYIGINY